MLANRLYCYGILLCIGLLLTGHRARAQQQSQYTQYMYNTMGINPAYTGARGRLSILGIYRNQWVGINGAPETLNLSIDGPLGKDEKVGLGLEFINDQIGPSNNSTVAGNFSYTISPKEDLHISFGLKGGITTLNLDPDKLNIYDQQNLDLSLTNYTRPLVGLGVYFYGRQWFVGVSTPNFLETKHYDDYKLTTASEKAHFYLLGGYSFALNPDVILKPIGMVKAVVGAPTSVDLSINSILYNKFTFGVGYRFDAAVSAMAGFKINDQLLIGYAYDYSTSEIAHYNNGSHEVFLRFELFNRSSSTDRRFSSF